MKYGARRALRITLLAFLGGGMSMGEARMLYQFLFTEHSDPLSDEAYEILGTLFSAFEVCSPTATGEDPSETTEARLREDAERALAWLRVHEEDSP